VIPPSQWVLQWQGQRCSDWLHTVPRTRTP
jgi:hypothetical protein